MKLSAIMCCMLVARSQFLQSYHENLDNYGAYDIEFYNVDDEIINQLRQESVIDDIGSVGIVGKIGLNDETTNYYYTSVIAYNNTIFNQLEEYLVDGEIDVDGIQTDEKVLIINDGNTWNTCENPFNVGDTIHLFNTYFDSEETWKTAPEIDFSYYVDTQVLFKDVEVCGIIQVLNGNPHQTLLIKDYAF